MQPAGRFGPSEVLSFVLGILILIVPKICTNGILPISAEVPIFEGIPIVQKL